MESVSLPVGEMLMRPGDTPAFAHFMTSGIASVVTYMKDGGAVEELADDDKAIALVGGQLCGSERR